MMDADRSMARRAGDWISRTCPRCRADESLRKVRADAAAFSCQQCGYDWAVKRMPLDAEAADILRRSRQRRADAPFKSVAESTDGKAARRDEAS